MESEGTARLSAAARGAIRQDDTIEGDGDLGYERDRLDGRSRAEQQPPLFSTIQVCPKDRLNHGPAGW